MTVEVRGNLKLNKSQLWTMSLFLNYEKDDKNTKTPCIFWQLFFSYFSGYRILSTFADCYALRVMLGLFSVTANEENELYPMLNLKLQYESK